MQALSENTEKNARRRIVKGARKHFLTHGFRGVTMDHLAGEFGMSKKTLYVHFESKHALLEAVMADKFGEIEAELNGVVSDARYEFPERLHALLACVRRHAEELQPPFLRDMAREMPEVFEKVRARRRAIVNRYFAAVLREGRDAGMIRSDVPERIMIEFLIGAADAIATPQKLTELGLTARAAFTEIILLFLEGTMTERGRGRL